MPFFHTLIFSFLLGIIPALLWLWFWLKEDAKHPEPKRLILLTFLYGGLSVLFALLFQIFFNSVFKVSTTDAVQSLPFGYAFLIVCIWAFIEEFVKYQAAWHGGLKKTSTDEPVDVPIYMISAALGFAALENTLFLIQPLLNGSIEVALVTTKLRFIGASLVHVASSALIGMFIGYSFYFTKAVKKRYIFSGFMLATVLHALFNLFIIKSNQNSFIGFLLIWFFVVLIVVLFEGIKRIKVISINNVREKEKENTH